MKRLFWLCVIALLAAVCAYVMVKFPGYLAIGFEDWLISMPLWLGCLAILATWLILFGLASFLRLLRSVPERLSYYWKQRRYRQQKRLWQAAAEAELTEVYEEAEKGYVSLAKKNFVPRYALLMAAKLALLQSRQDMALTYLNEAGAKAGSMGVAYQLLTIKMLWQQGKREEAQASLSDLLHQKPNLSAAYRLEWQFYLETEAWSKAKSRLSVWKKKFTPMLWCEMLKTLHLGLLKQCASKAELETWWHDLPRALSDDAELLLAFAHKTSELKCVVLAEKPIRQALQKSWQASLFVAYCQWVLQSPVENLSEIERWVKDQVETPDICLAMGWLCLRAKLPGRAKHYFEKGLKIAPDYRPLLQAIAAYYVEQKNYAKACEYYQADSHIVASAPVKLPAVASGE